MSQKNEPDKRLAAVCGLFCAACSLYIGSREDPNRLKAHADRLGITMKEAYCEGCRSDKRNPYCDSCEMDKCAAGKGLDFCGQCDEYPCQVLKDFQAEMPHRLELWNAHRRIVEAGWETWYAEMNDYYSCPECGILNSTYDRSCRSCGAVPSCGFVRDHQDEVTRMLKEKKIQLKL